MLKVSLITVCYNSENTIENTINSVISQNFNNIEYIIIDGGSNDQTLKILDRYKEFISKFITEKDNGIYDAMNKGINMATGDIVGIINSDDFYDNNNVIHEIASIFQKTDCECVYGNLVYINKDNRPIRIWKTTKFTLGGFSKGWNPPHPSVFFRRDVYQKYGLYDCKFKISADFEFLLRVFERYKIKNYYHDKTLVRMRSGGVSNRSIKNIIIGNYFILKAFFKNKIKVNYIIYPFIRIAPKALASFKSRLFFTNEG